MDRSAENNTGNTLLPSSSNGQPLLSILSFLLVPNARGGSHALSNSTTAVSNRSTHLLRYEQVFHGFRYGETGPASLHECTVDFTADARSQALNTRTNSMITTLGNTAAHDMTTYKSSKTKTAEQTRPVRKAPNTHVRGMISKNKIKQQKKKRYLHAQSMTLKESKNKQKKN